jgi:hypothetical protein
MPQSYLDILKQDSENIKQKEKFETKKKEIVMKVVDLYSKHGESFSSDLEVYLDNWKP